MRKHVDYARVEQLLDDDSLSYNEVADRAGCSSWSVRKFDRERRGDTRPMKGGASWAARRNEPASNTEPLGVVGWLVIAAIGVAIVVGCTIGGRRYPGDWPPFPGSGSMS
jgi:hypothetical protein